jgi:hypothetical protein
MSLKAAFLDPLYFYYILMMLALFSIILPFPANSMLMTLNRTHAALPTVSLYTHDISEAIERLFAWSQIWQFHLAASVWRSP